MKSQIFTLKYYKWCNVLKADSCYYLLFLSFLTFTLNSRASNGTFRETSMVPVGIGVALPAAATNLFFRHNPSGLFKQEAGNVDLYGGKIETESSTNYAVSLGYGTGRFGFGVLGLKVPNATTNIVRWGIGFDIEAINLALGADGDDGGGSGIATNRVGFILNPRGFHRFAFMTELSNESNKTSGKSWCGYAYGGDSFSFVVDALKIQNTTYVLLAPGIAFHDDGFQVSMSYLKKVNTDSSSTTKEESGVVAAALGYSGSEFAISVFVKHVYDSGITLSAFF